MVAPATQTTGTYSEMHSTRHPGSAPIRARSTLQRLFLSMTRLASLQGRIWLVRTKITATKIMMYAVLYAFAGVLAVLALIFLYIGVFQLLTTYVMAPQWAYLLYGFVHLGIAIGLMMYGGKIIRSRDEGDPEEERREQEEYAERERQEHAEAH